MSKDEENRIKEFKSRLSADDLEVFHLATRLAKEEGWRQATPRDVLDMD